ncbi:siderophore-interacting protein [Agromyces protaetiae]|uniref:Siderophore-interacting protein n=1 Tax=Agromyces protaetiae TaxID=2509455 RepID=A0A4V0YHF2_9MICO|nr:siderophore-interacting protein [Agromyces protaetiae]QAY74501.1 siderophore-interacting protein [Agromyces protaetiae]
MLTSVADAARRLEARPRPRPAYRGFQAAVARVERLSPHFVRVTFTGDDLDEFGTAGLDQRVKLVLPHPEDGFASFPTGDDWYREWRALPAARRNVFRTYTVRAVRPSLREVDVDFALHGDLGPASAWAERATPGDEIVIIGPDERSEGRALGIDFRPGRVDSLLLAGDETAAPAICAILEQLPADASGAALIEIPTSADELPVTAPAGVEVRWLARSGGDAVGAGETAVPADHGDRLVAAVRDHVARRAIAPATHSADDADRALAEAERAKAERDNDIPLWDVPSGRSLDGGVYAWLAGEASVITALRRFLVRDAGLDRRQVAFMGYWRRGRAEVE